MPKRISLGLDDDSNVITSAKIDLAELTETNYQITKPSIKMQEALEKEGEKFGFVSRQSKRRPAKKRSPFTIQSNIKMRVGMKELFQDVSEKLEIYDQETLELALQALIEKEGLNEFLHRYDELVK